MKKNLLIAMVVLILVGSIVFYLSGSLTERLVTGTFDICSFSKVGQEVTSYSIYVEKDGKYINIDPAEFNFPDCLEEYYRYVKVRVTYSKKDYKVEQCALLDPETGLEIIDLSEDTFRKLVDIEYGKEIIEKKMTEKIKLSKLTPEEIYKYIASKKITEVEIINDTGKDCIIYAKYIRNNDLIIDYYETAINPCNGKRLSVSFKVPEEVQAINIMYKVVNTNEILSKIKEEDIIYLSEHKKGDTLEYTFFQDYNWVYYIYNDTDKIITLVSEEFEMDLVTMETLETTKTIEIEPGRIYGFSNLILRNMTIAD